MKHKYWLVFGTVFGLFTFVTLFLNFEMWLDLVAPLFFPAFIVSVLITGIDGWGVANFVVFAINAFAIGAIIGGLIDLIKNRSKSIV